VPRLAVFRQPRYGLVEVSAADGEADLISGARNEGSRIQDSRRDLVVEPRGSSIRKGCVEEDVDSPFGTDNEGAVSR